MAGEKVKFRFLHFLFILTVFIMRSFSFVHLADVHLGFTQYNLSERREDFSRAFIEAVDKILKLKPSYAVFSGDIFDSPRPSNQTLATAVREFRRLKEAGVKVFAVDGSHDLQPNVTTGTVLIPLHNAGLIFYLPRLSGGCWEDDYIYIFGVQSCRGLREADSKFSVYFQERTPNPRRGLFNIFAFHGALDDVRYSPPWIQPDIRVSHLWKGFNYYAGGHVHEPLTLDFEGGKLCYPGCLETTSYDEADIPKGFNHVIVESLDEPLEIERVNLEGTRKFIVHKEEYENGEPDRIVSESCDNAARLDEEDAVLVLVLKGSLVKGAKRSQINISKIKASATKSLYVAVVNQLTELNALESVEFFKVREMKTLAVKYFFELFRSRYGEVQARRLSERCIELLDILSADDTVKVRKALEEMADDLS